MITEFLLNGFIYEPDTGFKNVHKILPGSYFEIDFTKSCFKIKDVLYWKPGISNIDRSVKDLIEDSILSQTVSDVPVGLFFSGGVDSSIILSKLRDRIESFTVESSKEEYENAGNSNDYRYASIISKLFGVSLNPIRISDSDKLTGDELLNYIDILGNITEEPIADFTFISSQILSRSVKKRGFTVMLSGMGADELFAGYSRYRMVKYQKVYRKLRWVANAFFSKSSFFSKKIERFNTFLDESDISFKYTALVGIFSRREIKDLMIAQPTFDEYKAKIQSILEGYEGKSMMKKTMLMDRLGFLSHNFSVADKSSMLESVELRVPLATKDLFDVAFNLPDRQLVSFFRGKIPLRKLLYKDLSRKLVDRRKAGFNPPLDAAITDIGADRCFEFMEARGLFLVLRQDIVSKLIHQHYNNTVNNTYKIYSLLYLSAWLNNFQDDTYDMVENCSKVYRNRFL